MKIGICDDCTADRKQLLRYIEIYLGSNCMQDVELCEYSAAEELFAERRLPDLLFLDIYMDRLDGMKAARQLLQKGYEGGLVFITSATEFAAESYEVNALDYLVKPYPYERFQQTMRKCSASLKTALSSVSIPSGRQKMKVFLRDLIYVETGNHCMLFHTRREIIKSPLSMEQSVQLLSDSPDFIRCHRSYIINLSHVEQVRETGVLMSDGSSVLLNVRNASALRKQIADHLWREMEARNV